jgi:hypothetical protein
VVVERRNTCRRSISLADSPDLCDPRQVNCLCQTDTDVHWPAAGIV